jgi:hypothetical protein
MMTLACESFGEDISHLKIARHTGKRYNQSLKSISNEVAIHLNMLGALMEDRIGGNVNDTCIISIKRSKGTLSKTKLNMEPV